MTTFSMSELNKTTRIAIETEDEDSGVAEKSVKEIEEEKKLEKEKQQKLVIRLLPIDGYTCKPSTVPTFQDDYALLICMLVLIGLTVFVVVFKVSKCKKF